MSHFNATDRRHPAFDYGSSGTGLAFLTTPNARFQISYQGQRELRHLRKIQSLGDVYCGLPLRDVHEFTFHPYIDYVDPQVHLLERYRIPDSLFTHVSCAACLEEFARTDYVQVEVGYDGDLDAWFRAQKTEWYDLHRR